MPNVDAPRRVVEFAESHGLDLAPYHQAVEDLQKATWQAADGTTKRYVDIEIPFAERVLYELQSGASIEVAVTAAVHEALESRQ